MTALAPVRRLFACGTLAALALVAGCSHHAASHTTAVAGGAVVSETGQVGYAVYYRDPHPVHVVDASVDDWCSIDGPHTHHYEPEDVDFYVVDGDGYYMFNGDPTYYVEEVHFEVHGYHGHHPFLLDGAWCYIDAFHHHHYAPVWYHRYAYHGHYVVYHGHYDAWYHHGHTIHLARYYERHTPRRVAWRRTHPHHDRGNKKPRNDDFGGTVTAERPRGASGGDRGEGGGGGGVVTAPEPTPSSGPLQTDASRARAAALEANSESLDRAPRPDVSGDFVTTAPRAVDPSDVRQAAPTATTGDLARPADTGSTGTGGARRGLVIVDDGTGRAPTPRRDAVAAEKEPAQKRRTDLARTTTTSTRNDAARTSRADASREPRTERREATPSTSLSERAATTSTRETKRATTDRTRASVPRTSEPRVDTSSRRSDTSSSRARTTQSSKSSRDDSAARTTRTTRKSEPSTSTRKSSDVSRSTKSNSSASSRRGSDGSRATSTSKPSSTSSNKASSRATSTSKPSSTSSNKASSRATSSRSSDVSRPRASSSSSSATRGTSSSAPAKSSSSSSKGKGKGKASTGSSSSSAPSTPSKKAPRAKR